MAAALEPLLDEGPSVTPDVFRLNSSPVIMKGEVVAAYLGIDGVFANPEWYIGPLPDAKRRFVVKHFSAGVCDYVCGSLNLAGTTAEAEDGVLRALDRLYSRAVPARDRDRLSGFDCRRPDFVR
jgi:hypothetical protein